MKPTLLFTTFLFTILTPAAFAKSEVELLRQRCAEQERQIRLLEEENLKLRLTGERYRPTTATAATAATAATQRLLPPCRPPPPRREPTRSNQATAWSASRAAITRPRPR